MKAVLLWSSEGSKRVYFYQARWMRDWSWLYGMVFGKNLDDAFDVLIKLLQARSGRDLPDCITVYGSCEESGFEKDIQRGPVAPDVVRAIPVWN